jgi:hypothetical protein
MFDRLYIGMSWLPLAPVDFNRRKDLTAKGLGDLILEFDNTVPGGVKGINIGLSDATGKAHPSARQIALGQPGIVLVA